MVEASRAGEDEVPIGVPRQDVRRGILLLIVGLALFSILNALVKSLTEHFPIEQIILMRNAFALPPLLLLARNLGGGGALRMNRPSLLLVQAVLFTGGLFGMFHGYRHLPLADATAIAFAQPLIVVALAAPLLGERPDRTGWIAVAIGFAGILLMAQPSGAGSAFGIACVAAGTVCGALSFLQQRRLSASETSLAIVFWTLAFSTMFVAPLLLATWVAPTPVQWGLLVVNGLASGFCQYLTTRALFYAPAARLAPATYTKMIFAVIIGWVWFGDVPSMLVLIGSVIVMFAGLMVYRSPASAPRTPAS